MLKLTVWRKQKCPLGRGHCVQWIGWVISLLLRNQRRAGRANNPVLAMLVITRATLVVTMVIVVPAAVGEDDAATQGQQGKNGNQPGDSTQHFKNPHGYAVMKPKLFIGCNMRPRLQRRIPVKR
jgi:hypothetical protein